MADLALGASTCEQPFGVTRDHPAKAVDELLSRRAGYHGHPGETTLDPRLTRDVYSSRPALIADDAG